MFNAPYAIPLDTSTTRRKYFSEKYIWRNTSDRCNSTSLVLARIAIASLILIMKATTVPTVMLRSSSAQRPVLTKPMPDPKILLMIKIHKCSSWTSMRCLKAPSRRQHHHAINISNPFFSTMLSNFNEVPFGCFLPCSHCRTDDALVFKHFAKTA